MSLTQFDWCGISDRLAGVSDDDVRSAALLIAYDVWQRRASRGKSCQPGALCKIALRMAWRRRDRDRRVAVCSAAVECAPARSDGATDRPALRLDRLTDRQRQIARLIMDGKGQAEIAAALGCSQPTVSRECERIGDVL